MSRYLAIDLDTAGLYIAAGSAGKVERALVWEDPRLPLAADNARGLGEGLREALKAAGVAPAPALVGLGRDRVIFKDLRFPPVPDAEEPAVVRFQAMKEMTESADDVVLDYVLVAGGAGERRATAVIVRKDVYAAVQALCAAAGLKLAGVTPRPLRRRGGAQAGGPGAAGRGRRGRPPRPRGRRVHRSSAAARWCSRGRSRRRPWPRRRRSSAR